MSESYGLLYKNRPDFDDLLYPAEIGDEVKKSSRGESTFRQCGNLVATAWKDNKVVNIASTLADPLDHTTVNR